jgi:hypothetical protein
MRSALLTKTRVETSKVAHVVRDQEEVVPRRIGKLTLVVVAFLTRYAYGGDSEATALELNDQPLVDALVEVDRERGH